MKQIQLRRSVPLGCLILAGMLAVSTSAAEPLSGMPLVVLTNVMQFNRLANQAQPAACTLDWTGMVRWVAADHRLAVFEDDSGAALVETDPTGQTLQPGQRVQISGEGSPSGDGDDLRMGRRLLVNKDGSQLIVGMPKLRVTGMAALSAPHQLRLGQGVAHDKNESSWAVAEGLVTFVSRQDASGLRLELSSGTGRMRVEIADAADGLAGLLLNSRVRLTGIGRNVYTLDGQITPGTMWVPGWDEVEILEAAPKLWSDQPRVAIKDWLATPATEAGAPVVHISGQVESVNSDQSLVITDGTGRVVFRTNQRLPHPQERIDVLTVGGNRGTNGDWLWGIFRPLENTTNRDAGQLPVLTTADQIMRLKFSEAMRAYPVRIRGVIIWSGGTACIIQDSTSGVYVDLRQTTGSESRAPRVGEYWEIAGATQGRFSPVIVARQTTFLGTGTLPEPLHPTRDQLLNGALDEHYVEIEGIAAVVETNRLSLLTHGGMIQVYLVPPLWNGDSPC